MLPLDLSFNESLICFAPKGSDPLDVELVTREAGNTRPLSLKNTDNKNIMSVNMKRLECTYSKVTHQTQNGFVRGRNFLNNNLDLDSAARLYSIRREFDLCDSPGSSAGDIPILGATEYEAAFPSVIHAWVWTVLRHRKLPKDYLNLLMALYHLASACLEHDNVVFVLINFQTIKN